MEKETNKTKKMNKEDELEMQQQIQSFYMQIQQVQQQLEIIAQQKMQFEMMISAINEIKLMDNKEKQTIVSLTPGIFVKAKMSKPEKVIINVGQNIMVEKTMDEALELLREQIEALKDNENNLREQFNSMFGGMH